MHNNAPDALLNDTRKHSERRWQTGVPFGEDIDVGTLQPGLVKGGVDGFLDVLAIEIDRGLGCPANEKKSISQCGLRWSQYLTGNPGHPTK